MDHERLDKVSDTAAYILNNLIHKEIDRQSAQRNDPNSFDINEDLENNNLLLFDFNNSISATLHERKHPKRK